MKKGEPTSLENEHRVYYQQRKEVALTFLEHIKSGKQIVSIDETEFYSHFLAVYVCPKKVKKSI